MNLRPTLVHPATADLQPKVVRRQASELRLHALFDKYGFGTLGKRPPAPASQPISGIAELVSISPCGTILKGFATYQRAKQAGQLWIDCVEYPVTESEALVWILKYSSDRSGLNRFQAIVLSIEATGDLRERARQNQIAGGKSKLLTNVSKVSPIDYRIEVARISGFGQVTVGKVQRLLEMAIREVIEALFTNRVSIHRAWLWLKTPERQLELLQFHLCEAKILEKANRRNRRPGKDAHITGDHANVLRLAAALARSSHEEAKPVLIGEANGAGKFILLSRELRRSLESQGELSP
jgi:hypothetical protein